VKFLRRLVKNGNSFQVSIPPEMRQFLQWNTHMGLVVEATIERTVVIRPARPDDMSVPMQPMVLDPTIPGGGR